MKTKLLDYITAQCQEKEKDKIHPSHVPLKEIKEVINRSVDARLEELVKEGKLKEGDTINDKYYTI